MVTSIVDKPPLVAIYMVTYNHEKFIDQAIQSVVQQKTSFQYRLFIGEDCSSDSTRAKCEEWQRQYPNKITLLESNTNLGINANATRVFLECVHSGAEYIALLEGDDFWTADNKLEKQVQLLKDNPTASGSYHNSYIEKKNGEISVLYKKLPPSLTQEMAISKYAPFHTSSFIFRSRYYCRPDWLKNIDSVDLAMYAITAQFGPLIGINECMSHYRMHEGGHTSTDEHLHHFHQKRMLLHSYVRGKIKENQLAKFQSLIRFHQDELKKSSAPNPLIKIGFSGIEDGKMSPSRYVQISLDGDIMPFQVSNDSVTIHQKIYPRKWWHWNKKKWMLRCFQQHFQGIPEVFYFQNPACFTSIIELIPDWNFPTILDFNTKEISTLIKDNDNIISLPTYASHPIPFDECVLPVFDHLYPVKKNTVAFLVNAQEAQGAFYQSPHPDFESICLSINDQRIEDPYFVSRLEALVVIEVKGFLKTHYVQLESQGVKVIFPTQFENQLSLTESPKHLYSDGHWITELKRAIDLSSEPIKKNSLTEHCRVLNTIIFNMKRNEN